MCNNGFMVNVFLICSYRFSRSDPDKHSRVRKTLQHSLFTWLLSQTTTTVHFSIPPPNVEMERRLLSLFIPV